MSVEIDNVKIQRNARCIYGVQVKFEAESSRSFITLYHKKLVHIRCTFVTSLNLSVIRESLS